MRVQDLNRNRPAVSQILREIDRGHAPATNLALDRIPISESDLTSVPELRHLKIPARRFQPMVDGRSKERPAIIRERAGKSEDGALFRAPGRRTDASPSWWLPATRRHRRHIGLT